jgi:hypothetical protein
MLTKNQSIKIEKWITEAWQETGKELLGKKIPRDVLWKEAQTITFPFFHFLEKTRNKFSIDKTIMIIPEYRRGTPNNVKCWGDKHRGKGILGKYTDSDSIDICIVKFNEYPSANVETRCCYWCYQHTLLAAIEFKEIGEISKFDLIKTDIAKLKKICGQGCLRAYMGVNVVSINEKRRKEIKNSLIRLLPKNNKIKMLFGSTESKEWGVY